MRSMCWRTPSYPFVWKITSIRRKADTSHLSPPEDQGSADLGFHMVAEQPPIVPDVVIQDGLPHGAAEHAGARRIDALRGDLAFFPSTRPVRPCFQCRQPISQNRARCHLEKTLMRNCVVPVTGDTMTDLAVRACDCSVNVANSPTTTCRW